MQRADAEALDRTDPVAGMRDHFDIPDGGPIYLDGNSLGRPPRVVVRAVSVALDEWTTELVGGWDGWIDLPAVVGDHLAPLVGAAAGQVLVCDSTTVNIYKLASAALAARPDRDEIIADGSDFPTDRYVLEGLARATGRTIRWVDSTGSDPERTADEVVGCLGDRTALVCLSHVHYRSGARLDGAVLTRAAHERGALVLWDLAHSAGSVPVDLDGWGADLAVGCTYKYLNSGPGAPGWLYVRRELHDALRQPIQGWFGQADQFAMGAGYRPAPGARSFLTGTPGIVALRAVDAALSVTAEAGMEALWAKSQRLTALLVELADDLLAPLGARLVTPRSPAHRGAHVSVAHPEAWPWCRTLIGRGRVVGDFRAPDVIRLGPAPLYTRFVDCFDAVTAMAEALAAGLDPVGGPARVT